MSLPSALPAKKPKVILFRHLPTSDDVNDYYTPAQANPPLIPIASSTEEALKTEMRALCGRHPDIQFVFSDNPRGQRSAERLLRWLPTECRSRFDERLNNILQPEWGGMHQRDVQKTSLYRVWHDAPYEVHFKDGESLRDVERRITSLCDTLGDTLTMFVSHTTPMQAIACYLLGLPGDRIWRFKFEHLKFSLIHSGILCRFNADSVVDFNPGDIRL